MIGQVSQEGQQTLERPYAESAICIWK